MFCARQGRGESISLTMPRMSLKSDGGQQGDESGPGEFTWGPRLCDLMPRKRLAYLFAAIESERDQKT
jgi:hypothetical protein